jgi:hypothetical protein
MLLQADQCSANRSPRLSGYFNSTDASKQTSIISTVFNFNFRSALDSLGLMVRLKVPGVAESILQDYVDVAIDILHNTPSPILKVSALHLVEILLLSFPKGINSKLDEIRDVARQMLVDEDQTVVITASRIYVIVFHTATQKQM